MDITPLIRKGQYILQSYAGGVFKVSGQAYDHSIIVAPDFIEPWDIDGISSLSDLTVEHFSCLIDRADEFDVILLGSGKTMEILPAELRLSLKKAGLTSVDSMDTGAACRTYNVLMAEGRRVVCALLTA